MSLPVPVTVQTASVPLPSIFVLPLGLGPPMSRAVHPAGSAAAAASRTAIAAGDKARNRDHRMHDRMTGAFILRLPACLATVREIFVVWGLESSWPAGDQTLGLSTRSRQRSASR